MKTIVILALLTILVTLTYSRSAMDENKVVVRDGREAGRKKKNHMKKRTRNSKKRSKNLLLQFQLEMDFTVNI